MSLASGADGDLVDASILSCLPVLAKRYRREMMGMGQNHCKIFSVRPSHFDGLAEQLRNGGFCQYTNWYQRRLQIGPADARLLLGAIGASNRLP